VPRDWLWSRCACEGDHEERRFESDLDHERPVIARIVTSAANMRLCCKYGAHVTIPLILRICVAAAATTAGRVAPGRNDLVPNRRAPKSGTAARVTTMVGSDPKPAMSTRARTTRTGSTQQTAWCVRDAVRPESGTARQRNQVPTAFRGTRRAKFCERPKVTHVRDRRNSLSGPRISK
jgi:hypothetical protein